MNSRDGWKGGSPGGKGSTRRIGSNAKKFQDNYDAIFRKKEEPVEELWTEEQEKRMDIIGSNGNDGIHYGEDNDGL